MVRTGIVSIFVCFLLGQFTARAGVVRYERKIEILPENLPYYSTFQKPDFAFLFLIRGIVLDSMIRNNPARNKVVIDSCIRVYNGMFFRLVYRNAKGEIFRYVDISLKKDLVAEGIKTDPGRHELEITKYYKSGSVQSKTGYLHQFRDSKGNLTGEQVWFGLNPNLVKHGPEKMYYLNGTVLIERAYEAGKLKDGLYTEYYDNGNKRKTYNILNGLFDGRLEVYNKQGKLVVEKFFDGNKVKNVVYADQRNDRKKAFLFGVDKYSPPKDIEIKNSGYPIRDLAGCVNDIELLGRSLEQNGFSRDRIFKISDDSATKLLVEKAFEKFIASLKRGDIAFIHFSGNGFYDAVSEKSDSEPELIVPCRDSYLSAKGDYSYYIRQRELEEFFSRVKKRLGTTGQLILSIDICHAGFLLPDEVKNETAGASSFRGETNNLLTNLERLKGAPTCIITGTSKTEFAFETRDDQGKVYGLYSYMLAKALENPALVNTSDLFQFVTDSIKSKNHRQTPGYFAKESLFLFEAGTVDENKNTEDDLSDASLTGNPFVVSVGINTYNNSKSSNLRFQNSASDAARYADFFNRQFTYLNDEGQKRMSSRLLLNDSATKEKIINVINDAISATKPEDYFIFNFSGYCKPLADSMGKKTTYFVPYGLKDISDDNEIRTKGISLTQLKDLLQLIPANNQLFITEAGATADFQREFIQALIETSPTIATLSNKNRFFIVPNSSGLDNCNCLNQTLEQGPINYYITNLDADLNVYGIFRGGVYTSAVRYALTKTETDCDFFRTPYFNIFSEKDFVADLKYFLPEELMQSRGFRKIEEDRKNASSVLGNRYAFVIGTDKYEGKPDWKDLNNPGLDAKEVAETLEKNYNYRVKLLLDAPADSIYDHILKLSGTLRETDQLLVYVAGHGDFDEKLFDDGFIVCNNSLSVSNDPYRNSYIQYSKLSRMINKLPAQQILMVLDVCFGGTFDERVARNNARSRNTYDNLSAAEYISEKMKKKTRLYLTSGGKREVPDGYKGKHSPFAVRLLQALDAKGGSAGILTASDLFQFVKMLPSGPLIGSFGDDEPGSEFVLIPSANPITKK